MDVEVLVSTNGKHIVVLMSIMTIVLIEVIATAARYTDVSMMK